VFSHFTYCIFLSLLFFNCSEDKPGTEGKEVLLKPKSHSIDSSKVDTNNLALITTYYENGNVKFHGYLIDSVKHGYCKHFFPNDNQIKMQGNYRFNIKSGWFESYFMNGNIKSSGRYKKDVKEDFWTYYNPNKTKLKEGSYFSGMKNGLWIFYDSFGLKKSEMNYKNDINSGLTKKFINDSILIEKGNYLKGEKEGWIQFYNNDGSLREESAYIKGIRNGGHKLYIDNYLFCEGTFKNDKKVGVWTEYNPEGKIISQVNED
jgi:antitoxin component YwqK of YwqJK toxin-antitoxin module